jgi:hypothetical protein
MPWHDRTPDPWYAIRIRKGPCGIVYRVTLTRHGKNVATLFRERDFGSARAALKAARAWRDQMTQTFMPETKQEFSQRLLPANTSGCPGVYLKRQVVKRGHWTGEYAYWQARSPEAVKPVRTRSFSVDRYGFDGAYALAVNARTEFVAEVEGYVGVAQIPERFRPAA